MLGVGNIRTEAIPSSSSLSALARPFTINRPIAKHDLDSVGDSTQWSSAATVCSPEDCFFQKNRTRYVSYAPTESLPSAESFSVYTSSLGTQSMPSINPVPTTRNISSSFASFSDSTITTLLELTPYYSQYPEPSAHMASNRPDFDLLSSVSPVSVSTCVCETECLQNLPTQNPAAWDSYWNNGERGALHNHIGPDLFSGQKEENFSLLSMHNYANPGVQAAESMSIVDRSVGFPDKRLLVAPSKETFTPFLTEHCAHDMNSGSTTSEAFLPFASLPYDLSNFDLDEALEASEKPFPTVVIRPPSLSSNCLKSGISCEEVPSFYPLDGQETSDSTVLRKGEQPDRNPLLADIPKTPVCIKTSKTEGTCMSSHTFSNINLDQLVQGEEEPQVSGSRCSVNSQDSTSVTNFQKYDDLDHLNPGVDSPCWKGSSYFSQPDHFQFAHPQIQNEMVETCTDLILQEQSHIREASTSSLLGNCASDEDKNAQRCLSSSLAEPLVLKCPSDDFKSTVSTEKIFHRQHIIKVGSDCLESCGCDPILASDAGMNDFFRRDDAQLVEPASYAHLSSDLCHIKPSKSLWKKLAAENVKMIVDVMNNLSELLLFHCSDDVHDLNKHDQYILNQTIRNLNSCLAKTKQVSPGEQSVTFHQSLSHGNENISNAGVDSSPADLKVRVGDANEARNCNTVKEMKKILEKHYDGEGEIDPQSRLFKNLWLEAEAALCYANCQARLDRVKIEMGQEKYQHAETAAKEQERTVSPESNDEVSVMERFHILKHRDEKANYNAEEQVDADAMKLSFAGDLPGFRRDNLGNRFLVGWWDGSSSSECEHVP